MPLTYTIPAGYKYFVVHANNRIAADLRAISYASTNTLGTPQYLGQTTTGFFLFDLLGLLLGADVAYSYMAIQN